MHKTQVLNNSKLLLVAKEFPPSFLPIAALCPPLLSLSPLPSIPLHYFVISLSIPLWQVSLTLERLAQASCPRAFPPCGFSFLSSLLLVLWKLWIAMNKRGGTNIIKKRS